MSEEDGRADWLPPQDEGNPHATMTNQQIVGDIISALQRLPAKKWEAHSLSHDWVLYLATKVGDVDVRLVYLNGKPNLFLANKKWKFQATLTTTHEALLSNVWRHVRQHQERHVLEVVSTLLADHVDPYEVLVEVYDWCRLKLSWQHHKSGLDAKVRKALSQWPLRPER